MKQDGHDDPISLLAPGGKNLGIGYDGWQFRAYEKIFMERFRMTNKTTCFLHESNAQEF